MTFKATVTELGTFEFLIRLFGQLATANRLAGEGDVSANTPLVIDVVVFRRWGTHVQRMTVTGDENNREEIKFRLSSCDSDETTVKLKSWAVVVVKWLAESGLSSISIESKLFF